VNVGLTDPFGLSLAIDPTTPTTLYAGSGSGVFVIEQVVGPPPTVTLVAPTGTIGTTTPTYMWNAVAGATSYELWVGNTAGTVARINQTLTAAQAGCGAGTGTCTFTSATALDPGPGAWWMRARNGAGFGPWSNGMTFTVNLSGGTLPTLAPKWPILGGTHDQLGQTYGEYGAVTAGEFHSGIDIVADIGTVVVAAVGGESSDSTWVAAIFRVRKTKTITAWETLSSLITALRAGQVPLRCMLISLKLTSRTVQRRPRATGLVSSVKPDIPPSHQTAL